MVRRPAASLSRQEKYGHPPSIYSSIGSKEKSARLSAPQTDHRFLSLLLLKLLPRISSELLLRKSPNSPSSPLSFASVSSSLAASSASGVSSIVSRELIEGDLDLKDVGVLGMLDAELNEYIGYGSYVYFCGAKDGKGDVPPDRLGLIALACKDGALAL